MLSQSWDLVVPALGSLDIVSTREIFGEVKAGSHCFMFANHVFAERFRQANEGRVLTKNEFGRLAFSGPEGTWRWRSGV